MSAQSSHMNLPSPSKSTKRPYESNTPSALGTPKDTSGLSARSPGQPGQGDRSNKKARIGEEGPGNTSKELSKGGQWIVAKLEELERMYKEVLLAATAVIQYQTYTLRLGKKVRKVPIHLERRVKISWGNFEATRRHVQAYMHEAAQDASTPSSRNVPISVPLPPPSASLSVADMPTNIPLTSPIPLSAATMLSFHPDAGTAVTATASALLGATIPKLEGNAMPQPNTENYAFNMLSTLPGNNAGGLGNLDLSNMSMGDLAGLMGNNGFDFSSLAPPSNIQAQTMQTQLGNQNQVQGQGQTPVQGLAQPTQVIQNQSIPVALPDPTSQTETDRLLAQFGGTTSTIQNNPVADVQQVNNVSDDDMTALLASLGEGDNAPDFTNLDFGDMDFSNLGDMSGLFNTSTAPTEIATTEIPPPVAPVANVIPVPQPSVPVQQPQPQAPLQVKQETIAPVNPITVPALPASDAVDPNLDMSNVFDESQAIDLDDFNFEEGDQGGEGGVGISGDEFESLLAAFN